jgi:hypothetical protein
MSTCQECEKAEAACECLECGLLVCEFCFDSYHGVNCEAKVGA